MMIIKSSSSLIFIIQSILFPQCNHTFLHLPILASIFLVGIPLFLQQPCFLLCLLTPLYPIFLKQKLGCVILYFKAFYWPISAIKAGAARLVYKSPCHIQTQSPPHEPPQSHNSPHSCVWHAGLSTQECLSSCFPGGQPCSTNSVLTSCEKLSLNLLLQALCPEGCVCALYSTFF